LEHVVQGVGEKNKWLESWCFYKRKKNDTHTQKILKGWGRGSVNYLWTFAFLERGNQMLAKSKGEHAGK
jgi:hypothetical protein